MKRNQFVLLLGLVIALIAGLCLGFYIGRTTQLPEYVYVDVNRKYATVGAGGKEYSFRRADWVPARYHWFGTVYDRTFELEPSSPVWPRLSKMIRKEEK